MFPLNVNVKKQRSCLPVRNFTLKDVLVALKPQGIKHMVHQTLHGWQDQDHLMDVMLSVSED